MANTNWSSTSRRGFMRGSAMVGAAAFLTRDLAFAKGGTLTVAIQGLPDSLDTGISTRHLSCIETGKARASREMVARLADALDMPLRDRNALLRAAGYAAIHPESALAAPALDRVRQAIDLIPVSYTHLTLPTKRIV